MPKINRQVKVYSVLATETNRNITQQLVHELGLAIAQQRYDAENSLPSENEISQRYNVSRSSTREAVKMLTAKGMLSSRPRHGIRILPRQQWNMFDTDVLNWILEGAPSLLMLRDFLQLRLAIEPEAAALAAIAGNPAGVQLIEAALARMKRAEQGLEDALEADIAFHTSVLLASGNPFFSQFTGFIETVLRVSIRFTNRIKGVSAASYQDHESIYLAIAMGRPNVARTTAHDIQQEALVLIQQALDNGLK